MKKAYLLFAAPMALLGVAQPAYAAVTFGDQTVNNGTVLDNVLLDDQQTGNPVTGTTNQGATGITFTSATDTLLTQASGQAVITAVDGLLNSVTFFLTNGWTFTNFEFNLQGSETPLQDVTLHTNLQDHVYNNFDSNGANWAGAASNGEVFTSVTWTTNGSGYDAMKQIRLGGFAPAVPEPSTWAMMLIGFGAIGAFMRRGKAADVKGRVSFA